MRVADILSKSRNEEKLSRDDLIYLLGLSPDSPGETVSDCKNIFGESGWDVWEGPSRYYNRKEWKTEMAFD